MSKEHLHSTGDEALSRLSAHPGAGGDLVRAFRDSRDTEDGTWLETWFTSRSEKHYAGPLSDSDSILTIDHVPSQVEATPVDLHIRLKSVQASYFRGFREGLSQVDMDEDLIVIEGRNSSGKTSLAEALEWLFSGSLSRRENNKAGSAHELGNCISNRFRPSNEETWVSATFVDKSNIDDAQYFTLRRTLQEDYGTSKNDTCNSVLFLNDRALSRGEERKVLDRFFAGVPPLLMQHTLRDFVQGDPVLRQQYFERLLRLNELTELIQHAVMTDGPASAFPNPKGGAHLRLWTQLGSVIQNESSKRAHSLRTKEGKGETFEDFLGTLTSISRTEFPPILNELNSREEIIAALQMEQIRVRQDSFPILAQLRPRRQLSNHPQEFQPAKTVDALGQEMRKIWKNYETVLLAVDKIEDNNLVIAEVYKRLLDSGMIQPDRDTQTCPLCTYQYAETLSASRISTIENWNPIYESAQTIGQKLDNAVNSLLDVLRQSLEDFDNFLPSPPEDSAWDKSLRTASDRLRAEAGKLRKILEAHFDLSPLVMRGKSLVATEGQRPTSSEHCELFIADCATIIEGLAGIRSVAKEYFDSLEAVEAAIGDETSKDPRYRLRQCLIDCLENASSIWDDLRWEQAKKLAQKDLKIARESLMEFRRRFLEERRLSFSKGIESVWSSLRDDRYSSFSQLHIPPPRGRGFPVRVELKALLDDGTETKKVDALGVFSESQINALGIAAFVTRAKLLGHQLLIIDDPVQSMDDEHFKTFASDLIPQILGAGFQVVLLTHNETFARDISHYHLDRTNYITMSIRHSRKKGAIIEGGSRRVSERLAKAECELDEGRLEEAWRFIRLAIERLYTVTYVKYGPKKFKPSSWQDQTADYMWKSGVDEIIKARLPDSEMRLKEILAMTASGAHDKEPRGETDVRRSLEYLQKALTALELEAGG